MSNSTCENCKWWSEIGHAPGDEASGECRISRPQAIEGYSICAWPETRAVDWCGEFVHKDDRAARLLKSKFMVVAE